MAYQLILILVLLKFDGFIFIFFYLKKRLIENVEEIKNNL